MSNTVIVSTQEDLYEALYTSVSGETILLESGDYGVLKLLLGPDALPAIATGLVLMSANPAAPAVFSGLDLEGVSGLTLEQVGFDTGLTDTDFRISDSDGIVIRDPVGVTAATLDQINATPGLALEATGPLTAPAEFAQAAPALETTTGASAAATDVIHVSTAGELMSALVNATGGETIALKGGDYGELLLVDGRFGHDLKFPSEVKIVSENPDDPAVFSDIDLRGVENLTFESVTFDYTFEPWHALNTRPFVFSDTHGITLREVLVDGDLAHSLSSEAENGLGWARALSFQNGSNITVENTEILNFYKGLSIGGADNVVVRGNELHSLRMDGLNFVAVQGAVIEDNYIHDFNRSALKADHADMIQFWTAGSTRPSTDIVIRGNTLDIGGGDGTHSIFMRNEVVDTGQAGKEMYYQNITIEENVIVNAHTHGLTLGEADGVVVRNNTILHADGRTVDGKDGLIELPRMSVAEESRNVVIEQNVTHSMIGWTDQEDWQVADNAFVQDQNPGLAGWYGDVFISSTMDPEGGHDFRVLPGGMIDEMEAGATRARVNEDAGLVVRFHATDDGVAASTRVFDARHSTLDAAALPADTTFLWNLGDGTVQQGAVVAHTYADGGIYDVTLTVTRPGMDSVTLSSPLGINSPQILTFDAAAGFAAVDYGTVTDLPDPRTMSADGMVMGTWKNHEIPHHYVADMIGSEDFAINLTLAAEAAGSEGELFRIVGSFIAAIDDGELVFRAFPESGGEVRVETKGANLDDLATHDLSIKLKDGMLQLWIDGALATEAPMTAPLADGGERDLLIGNPWGHQNFSGLMSAFEITKDADSYPSSAQTSVLVASAPGPIPEPATDLEPEPAPEPELDLVPVPEPEQEPKPGPVADEPALEPVTLSSLQILTFDAAAGFAAVDYGTVTDLPDPRTMSADGMVMGIWKNHEIPHHYVADMIGSEDFAINLTLAAEAAGSEGELFRIVGSFIAAIDDGELVFRAFPESGGEVRVETKGANLDDLATHDLSIKLKDGMLQLWIDGALATEAPMTAPLADRGERDLLIGNPWGHQNFSGLMSAFEITKDADSYPSSAQTSVLVASAPGPIPEPATDLEPEPAPEPELDLVPVPEPEQEPKPGPVADEPALEPVTLSSLQILTFDAAAGFAAVDYGTVTDLPDPRTMSADGMVMGIWKNHEIPHHYVADMIGSEDFAINLTLAAEAAGSEGELFRIVGSFIAAIDDGELVFRAFPESGGEVRVETKGANLDDLATHDLSIKLKDGMLQLWIDGALATEAPMTAPLADGGERDLLIGNPWGHQNFSGLMSAFEITKDADSYPSSAQTSVLVASVPGPVTDPETAPPPPPPVTEIDLSDEPVMETVLLGTTGVAAKIAPEDFDDLVGAETFEMCFTLQADGPTSSGTLFRLNNTFLAKVTDSGEMRFRAFLDSGDQIWLSSKGAGLNDAEPHEVALRMDDSRLELWIDGALADSAAVKAPLSGDGDRTLMFGNPWGFENFAGEISDFTLDDTVGGPMSAQMLLSMDAPLGSEDLLSFDPHIGLVAKDDGIPIMLPQTDAMDADGLRLGTQGSERVVPSKYVNDVRGADEFRVDFGLETADEDSYGAVVALNNGFWVNMTKTGELVFNGNLDDGGKVRAQTKGLDLSDTEEHDVSIRHAEGELEIWVDGALAASEAMEAPITTARQNGLSFGNSWGTHDFDGTLTSFDLSLDARVQEDTIWLPTDDIIPTA